MSNTVVSLTHLFCIHKLVVDEEARFKRNWFYPGVRACGIFLFVVYSVVGVWFLLMLSRHFFFYAIRGGTSSWSRMSRQIVWCWVARFLCSTKRVESRFGRISLISFCLRQMKIQIILPKQDFVVSFYCVVTNALLIQFCACES